MSRSNINPIKPIQLRMIRIGLAVALALLWGCFASAQVVDEDSPHLSQYTGVGEDSLDFAAQSFISDLRQLNDVGVWLQRESGGGEVKISVAGDLNGLPDLNTIYYESPLLQPSTTGQFYRDSSFTTLLEPGQKYWVLVDGFSNLQSSGYSSVGVSNVFTDTGESMLFSDDAGQSWDSIAGVPMAIYVAGDTCVFVPQMEPIAAVVCPTNPATISTEFGFLSYLWSTGETSQSISVTTSGTYAVTVVDEDFCVGLGDIVVLPDLVPTLNLDSTYEYCEGGSVDLIVPFFYSSYEWNTGSTNSFINADAPGLYWVEAASSGGCTARDTTFVHEVAAPSLDLGNDTTLCEGGDIQFDAGPEFQSYAWSTGASTRSIFVSQDDSIFVSIVDSNGCLGTSDTVLVSVFPRPDSPEVSLDLGNLVSTFGFSYAWYMDGNLISGATAQTLLSPQPGAYQVLITNGFGCEAWSDTFVVEVEPFGNFIPSGFSPNGDGVNDFFEVEAIERFPDNSLTVFNRWGDQVFHKENYQNDWNGVGENGSPLPDGNYFYLLDLGDGTAPRRGNVLLNR